MISLNRAAARFLGLEAEDAIGKSILEVIRNSCLLYTSDAADERSSVDLGGRRIIKKKKREYVGGLRIIVRINTLTTTLTVYDRRTTERR